MPRHDPNATSLEETANEARKYHTPEVWELVNAFEAVMRIRNPITRMYQLRKILRQWQALRAKIDGGGE